jgi:hypothetical protein
LISEILKRISLQIHEKVLTWIVFIKRVNFFSYLPIIRERNCLFKLVLFANISLYTPVLSLSNSLKSDPELLSWGYCSFNCQRLCLCRKSPFCARHAISNFGSNYSPYPCSSLTASKLTQYC